MNQSPQPPPDEVPAAALAGQMDRAWAVTWERFYLPRTHQFYDYLTSYDRGQGLAHLPTAAEVQREEPNDCGYGTGMEDCMISAGVMLALLVDRHAVTGEATLADRAAEVLQGIQLSATAHGVPGFLARGVCPEDLTSCYPTSSRDQYTHAVHGLWHYLRSPLCGEATRPQVAAVIATIADRMARNVTPENDYDALRLDGRRDQRGINRMWQVKGHEAARLPMIHAAAWEATGDDRYRVLWQRYLAAAVAQSAVVEEWQPTYAWLQMQGSLELLLAVCDEPDLTAPIRSILARTAGRGAARAVTADRAGATLDLAMLGSDWRTGEGLSSQGSYRPVWYTIRESGEAALVQLLAGREAFDSTQQALLARAIGRLDYDRVSSFGIAYLQAAYWKARRLGHYAV